MRGRMELDIEGLSRLVLAILERADAGTVITVHPHGAIETESPGTRAPGSERREPLLATFVANRHVPSQQQVIHRIRDGQRRLEAAGRR